MKTILIPTEDHDAMPAVLDAARIVARTFDSYMEGFAVRPAVATYVTVEPVSSLAIAGAYEGDSRQANELFTGFMQKHAVPAAAEQGPATYSFGWPRTDAAEDSFIGSYGRVFDLIALGRPGPEAANPRMAPLEAALFESGRPVLVVPKAAAGVATIGRNILISWNRSTQQARTNAFARVAVCGLISGYNGEPIPLRNPSLILVNRLRIEGFIVSEHLEQWPEALAELGALVADGRLRYRETVAAAQAIGVNYLPAGEVARLPVADLVGRVERVDSGAKVEKSNLVSAVLGGEEAPPLMLSGLREAFERINVTRLTVKSERQMRRWRGQRDAAVETFMEVLGGDRALADGLVGAQRQRTSGRDRGADRTRRSTSDRQGGARVAGGGTLVH